MPTCRKCGLPREPKKRCKPCRKASNLRSAIKRADHRRESAKRYRQANAERLKAYNDEWNEANRERRLERSRKYDFDHADERHARMKLYRAEHRDEIRSYNAEFYKLHRVRILKHQKKYNDGNVVNRRSYQKKYNASERGRVKLSAKSAARRARVKGALGSHTEEEWVAKKRAFKFRCIDCGMREGDIFPPDAAPKFAGKPMALTRGHAIPIAPRAGSGYGPGSHFIENIIPQCWPCNRTQGNYFVHPSVTMASLFDVAI